MVQDVIAEKGRYKNISMGKGDRPLLASKHFSHGGRGSFSPIPVFFFTCDNFDHKECWGESEHGDKTTFFAGELARTPPGSIAGPETHPEKRNTFFYRFFLNYKCVNNCERVRTYLSKNIKYDPFSSLIS